MTLDANACKLLRPRITEALAALGKEFNLDIKAGNASYNETRTNATFKIEINTINAEGQVETTEAASYRQLHKLYNLPEDGLGKTIQFQGQTFTIIGLLPKSHRFPLMAKRSDGKIYKLPTKALVIPQEHLG